MENQNITSPAPKPVMTGSPLETPIVPPTPEVKAAPGEKNEPVTYKTFVGELKTQAEITNYIKNLEESLVQTKASVTNPPVQQPVVPPAKQPTAKERFAELIFSNPDQAFDVVRQDVLQEVGKATNAERQKDLFWNDFYSKNEHLKTNKPLIDYIVEAKKTEIAKLPDAKSINDFLIKEASGIIDPIKKQYSGTETKLESGGVIDLGSSGDSVTPPVSGAPSGPQSLTAQLLAMKNRRKK